MNELLLIAVAFMSSLITAVAGVGGGMILIAAMPGLIPAPAIVPVHGMVQIFSNSSRALFGWQHVRWEFMLGFAGGLALGGVVAAGITASIDLEYVPLMIGCWILYTVWVPKFRREHAFRGEFVVYGALQIVLGMMDVIKVALFALLGFSFAAYWWLIAGMSIAVVLGALVGTRLRHRVPEQWFRRGLKWLLTLLALRMIYLTLS